MGHQKTEFAEFFQASWEPCLKAVVASTGSVQLAEDQVAEAFARAWLSWRKVRRHPAQLSLTLGSPALRRLSVNYRQFPRMPPLGRPSPAATPDELPSRSAPQPLLSHPGRDLGTRDRTRSPAPHPGPLDSRRGRTGREPFLAVVLGRAASHRQLGAHGRSAAGLRRRAGRQHVAASRWPPGRP